MTAPILSTAILTDSMRGAKSLMDVARLGDGGIHHIEDLQAGVFRLGERLAHNLARHAGRS